MLIGPGEADRHLGRCIRSARSWADLLVVYGDWPELATRNLIGSYAHFARIGDAPLYERDEALARNELFATADDALSEGDIVVVLDADEQLVTFEPEAHVLTTDRVLIRRVLFGLAESMADSWNVHFLHLWNPEGTVHRVDGAWQPSVGTRIYRHRPGYRVESYGAWVCPPLPQHLMRPGPPVLEVLHWSYARPEHRAPKHERYTRLAGHATAHVDSILTEPTLEPVL